MVTGQQFRDSLKDPHKSKISYLTTSLQRALDYFDFMSKRTALLVFYEPNTQDRSIREVYFLQDHGEEIEKNFAFIGVTRESPEQDIIKPFLPRQDVPVVIAFVYNELGKLTALEALLINQENLKNKQLIRAYLKKMSEIAQATEIEYAQASQSLQEKIVRQQMDGHGAHDDHYDEDDDYEQQERLEELNLRKQYSTERHVKQAQDQQYEEFVRKAAEEKKAKEAKEAEERALEEARLKREKERAEFKARLANEKVDSAYAITLQLRFPSGQKVVREFDRRSKGGYVHLFAGTYENKGFENPNADFELSAGFPRKVIDKEATLESVFGTSDSEVVHVMEI